MTFGSLFSGIGGLDLGLERAGLACRWQVEVDPFARAVLERHWPGLRRHDDITTFHPDGTWEVDLVAGGFPCNDVSCAGRKLGIDGPRSGLWREFARVVRVLRPGLVLVENTPGLAHRGLGRVLGDLATLGYDAEWEVLSAAGAGAPHLRERLFILAYPVGLGCAPDAILRRAERGDVASEAVGPAVQPLRLPPHGGAGRARRAVPDTFVRGMADGAPSRVDRERVRGIGNAVCPAVAERIGRALIAAFEEGGES